MKYDYQPHMYAGPIDPKADEYKVTKTCLYCATNLEFAAHGRLFTFTSHDDAFCRDMTRHRVRCLEAALKSQQETYEYKFDRFRRSVDKLLAEHGLPTIEERAHEQTAAARMAWRDAEAFLKEP